MFTRRVAPCNVGFICNQVEDLLDWLDKRVSYFTITQFAGLIRCGLRLPPVPSAGPTLGNWLTSPNVDANDASARLLARH